MGLSSALQMAQAGQHVLVICKSKFEAEQTARTVYEKCNRAGERFSLSRNTLKWAAEKCKGSIEFGWADTCSGRRLDDFDRSVTSLSDRFAGHVFPEDHRILAVRKFADDEIARIQAEG
jgi:hypothetical protein